MALVMGVLGGALSAGAEERAAPAGIPQMTEIPAGSFATQWRAELGLKGKELGRLALNDDTVFACTSDNWCYWLSRSSGAVVSLVEVGKARDNLYDPVTLSDRVVFPSTSQLTVFDRKGKSLYKIGLRYGASSRAAAEQSLLFIGIDHPYGGRVSALDLRPQPYDVPPVWELMTRGQVSAAPALYQGMLFMGSRDGGIYAVRAGNRASLWPGLESGFFKTAGEVVADVKADKDGVFAASMDSKLYCLDLNTGHVRWTYYAGRPLKDESAPVPTATSVYLYVPGTGLVAIDKGGRQEIRKPKWVVEEGRQFLAGDEKYAYLRGADDAILAVEKQTGQVKFRSKRTDFTIFAVNTSAKDSLIYAGKPGGDVYAIKAVLKSGTVGELALEETAAGTVAMGGGR
jgi:hypothetical protein